MNIPPGLSVDGCRSRQARLLEVLRVQNLDGALLTDPRHVHYFSGYWPSSVLPAAFWLSREGEAVLSVAGAPPSPVAAQVEIYEASRMATLVEDLVAASLEPLKPRLKSAAFGCEVPAVLLGAGSPENITPQLIQMRRAKDADEVVLLRHAIVAAQALYGRAREVAVPGANEIYMYGQLLAAATEAAGEPIGPLGNDFQCAGTGAAPRDHAIAAGELWTLDISVLYRGYRCDLCRTICVGGEPTAAQLDAHGRVLDVLHWFERTAHAGVSCRELYQSAFDQLQGYRGWNFPHHLGHGTGLSPHEAPRLNPLWDDVLQVGDVVAIEPGLYGPDLRNGVRLEDNYLVTANGLQKLSDCELSL